MYKFITVTLGLDFSGKINETTPIFVQWTYLHWYLQFMSPVNLFPVKSGHRTMAIIKYMSGLQLNSPSPQSLSMSVDQQKMPTSLSKRENSGNLLLSSHCWYQDAYHWFIFKEPCFVTEKVQQDHQVAPENKGWVKVAQQLERRHLKHKQFFESQWSATAYSSIFLQKCLWRFILSWQKGAHVFSKDYWHDKSYGHLSIGVGKSHQEQEKPSAYSFRKQQTVCVQFHLRQVVKKYQPKQTNTIKIVIVHLIWYVQGFGE